MVEEQCVLYSRRLNDLLKLHIDDYYMLSPIFSNVKAKEPY